MYTTVLFSIKSLTELRINRAINEHKKLNTCTVCASAPAKMLLNKQKQRKQVVIWRPLIVYTSTTEDSQNHPGFSGYQAKVIFSAAFSGEREANTLCQSSSNHKIAFTLRDNWEGRAMCEKHCSPPFCLLSEDITPESTWIIGLVRLMKSIQSIPPQIVNNKCLFFKVCFLLKEVYQNDVLPVCLNVHMLLQVLVQLTRQRSCLIIDAHLLLIYNTFLSNFTASFFSNPQR